MGRLQEVLPSAQVRPLDLFASVLLVSLQQLTGYACMQLLPCLSQAAAVQGTRTGCRGVWSAIACTQEFDRGHKTVLPLSICFSEWGCCFFWLPLRLILGVQ